VLTYSRPRGEGGEGGEGHSEQLLTGEAMGDCVGDIKILAGDDDDDDVPLPLPLPLPRQWW
jgi:hypothetical protein